MRKACLIILALAVAAPAAAQTAADRRAFETQERMRNLGQNQQLNNLDRQVTNMDLQRRTDRNMQTLVEQSRVNARSSSEPYPTTQLNAAAPAAQSAYDKQRDAELQASNDRLRALMNDR